MRKDKSTHASLASQVYLYSSLPDILLLHERENGEGKKCVSLGKTKSKMLWQKLRIFIREYILRNINQAIIHNE